MVRMTLVAVLCFAGFAQAGPFGLFRPAQKQSSNRVTGGNLSAYESASISAQQGRMAHRGGSYAYEGVGYSPVSPDAAMRNCCFYGQRQIVESAVVRGTNGWYACIRYR